MLRLITELATLARPVIDGECPSSRGSPICGGVLTKLGSSEGPSMVWVAMGCWWYWQQTRGGGGIGPALLAVLHREDTGKRPAGLHARGALCLCTGRPASRPVHAGLNSSLDEPPLDEPGIQPVTGVGWGVGGGGFVGGH